ncbi:hypothetical protein [Helicovermis profundi]|uniref:Lipoprotein n=1 Tax=Helicovermis profundi TaxID=3065157 RepID=A0AAU9EFR2_9FIRM|nr:hypothetical protein HLPR_05940 [Clostridia bacterium S502]
MKKSKKILISLCLILILGSLLTGCSDKTYGNYKKAVEKTDGISKSSGEFILNTKIDFNREGLSKEVADEMNMYSDFYLEQKNKSDVNKTTSDIYVKLGGLGFNVTYYDDDKRAFVKLPMVDKYIYLDDLMKMGAYSESEITSYSNNLISKESIRAIKALWNDSIKKNDVLKGNKSLINTPEGEVKAEKYTIKYSDKLLKELLLKTFEILYKDVDFKSNAKMKIANKDLSKESVMEIKKYIELINIEKFELNSYIDIDGYIVKEDMKIYFNFSGDNQYIKKFSMNFSSKLFNIEKNQNIVFPKYDENTFISRNELSKGIPSIYKNIFNKK